MTVYMFHFYYLKHPINIKETLKMDMKKLVVSDSDHFEWNVLSVPAKPNYSSCYETKTVVKSDAKKIQFFF